MSHHDLLYSFGVALRHFFRVVLQYLDLQLLTIDSLVDLSFHHRHDLFVHNYRFFRLQLEPHVALEQILVLAVVADALPSTRTIFSFLAHVLTAGVELADAARSVLPLPLLLLAAEISLTHRTPFQFIAEIFVNEAHTFQPLLWLVACLCRLPFSEETVVGLSSPLSHYMILERTFLRRSRAVHRRLYFTFLVCLVLYIKSLAEMLLNRSIGSSLRSKDHSDGYKYLLQSI